jgi:hypothetical protein
VLSVKVEALLSLRGGLCSLCAAEELRIKRLRAFGGCLGTERR